MQKRAGEIWRIGFVGIAFVALLFPAGAWAQGKELVKIFKVGDLLNTVNPNPKERFRVELLTGKDNASLLNGNFFVVPAGGENATIHYHKNRESLLLIQSGQGVEIVEGKKIPVKAGDCIFVPAMVKHALWNTSDKDLTYMEFYTPTVRDVIEVKEK